MTLHNYVEILNKRYQTGISREHSYRGDLQTLLETLAPDVLVTNEPARIKCGAPDYVITKNDIPVGYIEAKDIGIDLKSKTLKEQFNRYRNSLDNLIFTDYMDFHLYIGGEFVTSLAIAEMQDGKIVPIEKNFAQFEALITDFCTHVSQSIKSSEKLSKMMAGKAKMLALVIEKALESDVETHQNSTLKQQLAAFEQILIHDITPREFADIYAQTIAYGMFAARLHDPTLPTFSRQEAAELIPKSNPFLRKMFQYIAGYDLDSRIVWIVDALADIFRATDVAGLLHNFGQSTQMNDPMIHFYENFLAEYDPKLRKARGVWYTPEPVVNFIVRAVDEVLKTEFGLKKGLADTSKTKVKVKVATKKTADRRSKTQMVDYEKEVHKVQILDPATGTGTFLAEVVKHIYQTNFKRMKGMWSDYVEKDLIPRLNGFELLMASYAMAHLKIDMLLTETGYKPSNNSPSFGGTKGGDQRLRIYLTNSLEEAHPDTGTLFANWLSTEASEANTIKRDAPVMVILGNPPYAVSSTNKSEWIQNLIADYKKNLNERKINLDDDYIKFIRYGQHFIDKNGEGVLAYISNNSFIDGITHRQMRKHLLESFDKIYILDLHGSAKKNETTSDGGKDENVFDIQQGVSINIFVKTGKKNKNSLGKIYHSELLGKREIKYPFLYQNTISSINWDTLINKEPYYFFVPKDFELQDIYQKYFSINDLFLNVNSGVKTDRDKLFIDISKESTESKFKTLLSDSIPDSFIKEYRVVDSGSYKITQKIKNVTYDECNIKPILYRPFDIRSIYYDPKIVSRPGAKVAHHILNGSIALVSCRQQSTFDFQHILVSNHLTEVCTVSLQTKETGYAFPLYLYPKSNAQQTIGGAIERTPNLDPKIIKKIANGLGLTFVPEKTSLNPSKGGKSNGTFAPIDVLDYIYAVLHSPTYRETYKEFLKIDFPRVPFPSIDTFWDLVRLGGQLRQVHLLEFEEVSEILDVETCQVFKNLTGLDGVDYPKNGDNVVTRKMTKSSAGYVATSDTHGQVWINDEQYFDKVPLVAWEFYIGGYQPAQKWLKDRKQRTLNHEDIIHYCKIIEALSATAALMQQIDKV